MGLFRFTKRKVVKVAKAVPKLADVHRITDYGKGIVAIFKTFFVPRPAKAADSFQEATKRLNIKEESLIARQKSLTRMAYFMFAVAILILSYGIYLFAVLDIKAGSVALGATLVALGVAFRHHFWAFQIKKRQLGCSIKQWYNEGLLGKKL